MRKILLLTILGLCSCQSGGGRVLPSLTGNVELLNACNSKPKDIIPQSPIQTAGFYDKSQNASAGMVFSRFLDGFEYVIVDATQSQIDLGKGLNDKDPTIWGIRPLANEAGIYRLEINEKSNPNCQKFEENLIAQGDANSMNFWRDKRFETSPRNWCIGAQNADITGNYIYEMHQDAKPTGTSTLNSKTETLTQNGLLIARRTQIWLSQPLFPVATSSTNIGCDLQAFGMQSDFVGINGIALKPSASPTLLPISNQ